MTVTQLRAHLKKATTHYNRLRKKDARKAMRAYLNLARDVGELRAKRYDGVEYVGALTNSGTMVKADFFGVQANGGLSASHSTVTAGRTPAALKQTSIRTLDAKRAERAVAKFRKVKP